MVNFCKPFNRPRIRLNNRQFLVFGHMASIFVALGSYPDEGNGLVHHDIMTLIHFTNT